MTPIDAGSFNESIVLCDGPNAVVRIGPLHVDHDIPHRGADGAHLSIFGPFIAITPSRTYTRQSGNGIDSLRLAQFRRDLHTLNEKRVGGIHLGDHDYHLVFELIAEGDGIQVNFTSPSADIFDREVAFIGWDRIPEILAQIDEIDRLFGPLTGYCEACARPDETYSESTVASHEFLVSYDVGYDIIRAVIVADSVEQITDLYPELTIELEWPTDLTDSQYENLPRAFATAPPTGILTLILDDRRK